MADLRPGDTHAGQPVVQPRGPAPRSAGPAADGAHLRNGRRPAAPHARHALALASEMGLRPLAAHCHFGLGKLYRRTGTREQAQEHLTIATAMYREMGMTYWLETAEAELKELA